MPKRHGIGNRTMYVRERLEVASAWAKKNAYYQAEHNKVLKLYNVPMSEWERFEKETGIHPDYTLER